MQPKLAVPRDTFTEAQITGLIRDDTSITIGNGMELIKRDLTVLDDVSEWLRGGSVSRDSLATLHGSMTFDISRQLSWGSAIVRPYMTISNGSIKARFNLGAYFTSTPATKMDANISTFDVTGYDILNGLNSLVGDSFAIQAGESYLAKVEDILLSQGYTKYTIEPTRYGTTAPSPKAWPMDTQTSWLIIVNELLKAVGYAPIYSDWDGRLVCQQHVEPRDRIAEWTYDRGQYTGQLVPGGTITHDYFNTPNRWVGIQGNVTDATTVITEGSGKFTYINQSDGETSVQQRGQTITKVLSFTAADQSALVAAVMAQVAIDRVVGSTIDIDTSANPLHWHNDIVKVETREFGIVNTQVTRWSMDIVTGKMQHSWAVL